MENNKIIQRFLEKYVDKTKIVRYNKLNKREKEKKPKIHRTR